MSRETDTPSSGPNGRGGAAYPSGTPPYGTPMATDDGAAAGRSGTQPEEKKTETTLTTRIRINIPGSRPIPPVVVRKPVGDNEGAGDEAPAADSRPAPERPAAAEAPGAPGAPGEEKASAWFAPRKSSAPKGGPGGGTNGTGIQAGSPAAATGSPGARPGGPGASGTAGTTGARSGGGRPGGVVGSMSVPGASRSGSGNAKNLPGATGGPVAPGHGGGTGSFDVTEALNAGPLGPGSRPGPSTAEPRRDDLPYFAETGGQDGPGANGQSGYGTPGAAGANGQGGYGGPGATGGHDAFGAGAGASGANGPGGPGGPSGFNGPHGHGGPGGPQGPAGPTGGPVTGDSPLAASAGGPGLDANDPFGAAFGGQNSAFNAPGTSGGRGTTPPRSALADLADLEGPAVPGAPVGGPTGLGPGGGMSDDTAILTPQKPAPEPGTPGYRPDNVSGHTVTSGIPVVPGAGASPFAGPGSDGPAAPAPAKPAAPKAKATPKKKGRSKLVLLGA
ncbi:hypothetical protein ACFC0P_13430, partial [Streptomyces broussonetiae]